LVETSRGGAAQGGAALTPIGAEVLRHYRQMQAATRQAIAGDIAALSALMTDMSQRNNGCRGTQFLRSSDMYNKPHRDVSMPFKPSRLFALLVAPAIALALTTAANAESVSVAVAANFR